MLAPAFYGRHDRPPARHGDRLPISGVGPPPERVARATDADPEPPARRRRFVDRFGDGNDRLALWYSGTRLMLDFPWAGVGLGQTRR